ncbi:MAG: DUF11 domain-containing protein [Clostridium sp.]|uniref:DUF11 domain-containing protein n=1 Tax=Clostridium sp. TaxID=1506 RepID=UPI0025C47590|nr:DUF11 domain-containing protein [Clostridium sp.]MCF0146796.1 DUF11 domain-containing protein [Clostridium sp.]
MFVLNMCRVDYKYKLSSLSPVITKTVLSNMVSTQIINEKIKITKFVDKEKAGSFDLLKYTIEIVNISDERVNNIFVQDDIPQGTCFLENSLTINNIKKRCVTPEKGFYITKLNIKEKIKITFKVIILKPKYPYIKNTSNIEYDYIYNIEEDPIRRHKESNTVKTKYQDNLFKEVLQRNTINLSSEIDCITKVHCFPKITGVKLINCYIKGKCGLLIMGKINCFLFCKCNGKKYIIEDTEGFSICMLVPIGISYLNKVYIKIKTESICTKLINRNTIAIYNSFFIFC